MSSTELLTRTETRVKKPTRYNVILINDDYTPFTFVISVLMQIFGHDHLTAMDLADRIHSEGQGVVGNYLYEIAEQKRLDVITSAQSSGYPLQAIIKPE